ncbi:MAG: PhoH family protein [Bacteroidales bacterium]|nr:PhoH family protein [Bacteroidales bacterium]MBN2819679.1 PhoH family protein [Bacteroidales bacterium]
MIEKSIYLEGIDPLYLYGANNILIDKVRSYFPKLKIIARGHEMITIGDEEEIKNFEVKIELLINFFHRYNKINLSDIEELFESVENAGISENEHEPDFLLYGNHGKVIKAKSINQQRLVNEFSDNDLLFALGPAGTGKTYTAIGLAVRALRNKEVKRIILTRPAVEAGENLGFLPGDLKEKLDPYLQPLYDALRDMIPAKKLMTYIEDGTIEIAPLAFMRGRTLDHAFVILDEGQNTTINQLKMFLTRMGKNAKFIVTGDITQIDLPKKTASGLVKAIELLKNISGISIVEFDVRDVVRHKLVKKIIEAYDNERE